MPVFIVDNTYSKDLILHTSGRLASSLHCGHINIFAINRLQAVVSLINHMPFQKKMAAM